MKPNDKRLYIYPNYRVEPVVVDPNMGTGELDYEWQAKLVMHEVMSKPLSMTQSTFVKMLAEAVVDKEKDYDGYLRAYSRLWECLSDGWRDVHNALNLIERSKDGK